MLRRLWNNLKQMSWFVVGLGAVFLVVGALGWIRGWLNENLGAELVGIGVTVIIIDTANRLSIVQQDKKRLIRQMRSNDNGLARQAVRDLRAAGWLHDGSLRKAELGGANLQGAFVVGADLQGTSLPGINLQKAIMRGVSLQGADLRWADLRLANLQAADFDENTILPDGSGWTPDVNMARFTDPMHPNFWRSDDPDSPAYRGDGNKEA